MSQQEAQRFIEDLTANEDLATEFNGIRHDPPAALELVRSKGYDASPDEIREAFLDAFGEQLSEEDLAAIAGGISDGAAAGIGVGAAAAGVYAGALAITIGGAAAAAI